MLAAALKTPIYVAFTPRIHLLLFDVWSILLIL